MTEECGGLDATKEVVYIVIGGVVGGDGLYSGGSSPARWLGDSATGSCGVVRGLVGIGRLANGTGTQ